MQEPVLGRDSVRDFLRRTPLLADLSEADMDRLVEGSRRVHAGPGKLVIEEGALADGLYVVLSGKVEVVRQELGEEVVLAVEGPGSFLGEMALLEDMPRSASVRTSAPSEFLVIAPEQFQDLLGASPAASKRMLRTVLSRLRSTEETLFEREKLAALGTLTAGLLHEINNPAAALPRTAQHLSQLIAEWGGKSAEVERLGLSGKAKNRFQELNAAMSEVAERLADSLSTAQSERDVESWLDERGFREPWELAPTLATASWKPEDLDELADTFGPEALPAVVDWLVLGLTLHGLSVELRRSAKAISEVVTAARNYSRQQLALSEGPVDIAESIENALVLFRHRISDGIELVIDLPTDLPSVEGSVSGLGQVWAILLENGLDALDGSGTLEVRATGAKDQVTVEIADDGSGIPPKAQRRIFEPFFTTKPPGQGTGMGLAIAHRIVTRDHGGTIRCQSRPGRTVFTVTLPVEGPAR